MRNIFNWAAITIISFSIGGLMAVVYLIGTGDI